MDNEIINEFNEKFGDKPTTQVESYHSVQNQQFLNNQDINNNFNNVLNTNVNNNDDLTNSNAINIMPEFDNKVSSETATFNNEQQLYDTTNYISNKPVEKKAKKNTIQINQDLKTAIILVVVLLVAMFFIPKLFDLYDSLRIKIFS